MKQRFLLLAISNTANKRSHLNMLLSVLLLHVCMYSGCTHPFEIPPDPTDSTPLSLHTASGVTANIVDIYFDDQLNIESALNQSNYTFAPPLTILEISVLDDNKTVRLYTETQIPDVLYKITVENLMDSSGNSLYPAVSETWFGSYNAAASNLLPEIIYPPNQQRIRGDAVELCWKGIPGATTYYIDIFANNDYNEDSLLASGSVNAPYTNFEVTSLDSRTYYWRVRSDITPVGEYAKSMFYAINGVYVYCPPNLDTCKDIITKEDYESCVDELCPSEQGICTKCEYSVGNKDNPYRTISMAIKDAEVNGITKVHVAGRGSGKKYHDSFELVNGIDINGGYSYLFEEPTEETFEEVIITHTQKPVIIQAEYIGLSTLLSGVTIEGNSLVGEDQDSIALKIINSSENLLIDNCTIRGGTSGGTNYAVYLEDSTSDAQAKAGPTFQNCVIQGGDAQHDMKNSIGLYALQYPSFTIQDSEIEAGTTVHGDSIGVFLEKSDAVINNNRISGNTTIDGDSMGIYVLPREVGETEPESFFKTTISTNNQIAGGFTNTGNSMGICVKNILQGDELFIEENTSILGGTTDGGWSIGINLENNHSSNLHIIGNTLISGGQTKYGYSIGIGIIESIAMINGNQPQSGTDPCITGGALTVSGTSMGIYIRNHSQATIDFNSISGGESQGSGNTYGIYAKSYSDPTLRYNIKIIGGDVTKSGSGGTSFGIFNYDHCATIIEDNSLISGGSTQNGDSYGIYSTDFCTITIDHNVGESKAYDEGIHGGATFDGNSVGIASHNYTVSEVTRNRIFGGNNQDSGSSGSTYGVREENHSSGTYKNNVIGGGDCQGSGSSFGFYHASNEKVIVANNTIFGGDIIGGGNSFGIYSTEPDFSVINNIIFSYINDIDGGPENNGTTVRRFGYFEGNITGAPSSLQNNTFFGCDNARYAIYVGPSGGTCNSNYASFETNDCEDNVTSGTLGAFDINNYNDSAAFSGATDRNFILETNLKKGLNALIPQCGATLNESCGVVSKDLDGTQRPASCTDNAIDCYTLGAYEY